MINTIRERVTVKNGGKVEISSPELVDGREVEVLILLDDADKMDETEYLLSTDANSKRMYEALEELKHPEKFLPLNIEEYEKRLADS